MHAGSLLRMLWFAKMYLDKKSKKTQSVLDVGSYSVNGNYRQFFEPPKYSYTGLDIEAGPNVDIVAKNPYHWDMLEDNAFDAVISGQAFEHIEFFWITMGEMARVLRPGGLLCLIAPRGFERHRYPVDCYRFDADGMVALARWVNLDILHVSTNMAPKGSGPEWYSKQCADSFLIARKPLHWAGILDIRNYKPEVPDLEKLSIGFVEKVD